MWYPKPEDREPSFYKTSQNFYYYLSSYFGH